MKNLMARSRRQIRETYPKGKVIYETGEQANSCYIVVKGKVKCYFQMSLVDELGPGDLFGEQALYMCSNRAKTAIAESPVELLSITRDRLTLAIGGHLQDMIFSNYIRWAFEKNKDLSRLPSLVQEKLVEKFRIRNKQKGQLIVSEAHPPKCIVIVLEGKAQKVEDPMSFYNREQILNVDEFAAYAMDLKIKSSSICMVEDGVIGELHFDEIKRVLNSEKIPLDPKGFLVSDSSTWNLGATSTNKEQKSFKLSDFSFKKCLGKGQFGHVYCVKEVSTGQLYAMKVISKLAIYDQGLESYVLNEKRVLMECNHPFLVSLKCTLQSKDYIMFLMEMVKGTEMFDVMRQIGLLSIKEARFYTASLILAIEFLHEKGIVYRDLKPENVMVDSLGFIRLIDMGAAKHLPLNSKNIQRTRTIIGTPHYMAPEIFMGKGYSFPVDLWAIGVCLYEFICGYLPFGETLKDPYKVYKEILRSRLQFSMMFQSPKFKTTKSLIERLLSRVPELRLGPSFSSLKAHIFFSEIEWRNLHRVTFFHPPKLTRKQKSNLPPYIPKPKSLNVIEEEEINITLETATLENQIQIDKMSYVPKGKAREKLPEELDMEWAKDF